MNIRKTKIVATLGPAVEKESDLEELFKAGVNVVRLNFSHGSHHSHKVMLNRVRKITKTLPQTIGILQDLSGPEIRTGEFSDGEVELVTGQIFTLCSDDVEGNQEMVSVSHTRLPEEVEKGDSILLDDGKIELIVQSCGKGEIVCRVDEGGFIKGRRSVSVPNRTLSLPSLTKKDKEDIDFGLKNKVDFIAMSFIRSADDVLAVRKIISKEKNRPDIVAKIETREAVDDFDRILEVSDGIMIARGDLSVEMPTEKVPVVQKMIIEKCVHAGKPVVTATQMLESMISSPTPTRAEVSDIANAVMDGTDAVMLSGETAIGRYPFRAVRMMCRVCKEVEKSSPYIPKQIFGVTNSITDTITEAVSAISKRLSIGLVIAPTRSGKTARMIARQRPKPLIYSFSDERVSRKLTLSFGCVPIAMKGINGSFSELLKKVRSFLFSEGLIKKGSRVILAGRVSTFEKTKGRTNSLRIEEM